MLNAMKKVFVLLVMTSAFLYSAVAVSDVTLSVDAKANCLDTASSTFPFGRVAPVSIPAGTYNVYISNNNMSCSGGNVTNGCFIDHIVVRGWPSVAGNWGFTATTTPVSANVSSATTFNAFVVDTPCSDNTGSATITFKGPL